MVVRVKRHIMDDERIARFALELCVVSTLNASNCACVFGIKIRLFVTCLWLICLYISRIVDDQQISEAKNLNFVAFVNLMLGPCQRLDIGCLIGRLELY